MKLTSEQLQAMRAVPLGAMPNKLRIAFALTKTKQTDAAQETGIAEPHLSRLSTGNYENVTVTTAQKLADYFGCHIEDLFPSREAVA